MLLEGDNWFLFLTTYIMDSDIDIVHWSGANLSHSPVNLVTSVNLNSEVKVPYLSLLTFSL